MERGINMAKQVELLEMIKVEGDLSKLNDADRLLVTIRVDGDEYRIGVPYQNVTKQADVKQVLTQALTKLRKDRKKENLTEQWKGVYNV